MSLARDLKKFNLEVNQLLVLEFKTKSSKLHEVLLPVASQNDMMSSCVTIIQN